MPDDSTVCDQRVDPVLVETCNHEWIEAGKSIPVALTFVEDGRPRQAGLGALEDEKLEKDPIVVNRDTPFVIVVGQIRGIACFGPWAAREHACVGSTGRHGSVQFEFGSVATGNPRRRFELIRLDAVFRTGCTSRCRARLLTRWRNAGNSPRFPVFASSHIRLQCVRTGCRSRHRILAAPPDRCDCR